VTSKTITETRIGGNKTRDQMNPILSLFVGDSGGVIIDSLILD
jgi:hypothetical protein